MNGNMALAQKKNGRGKFQFLLKFILFLLAIPLLLIILIYLKLSFLGPISLQFIREPIAQMAVKAMPENFEIELGDINLALSEAFLPTVQFAPAVLKDKENAANIEMQSIDVGFSPFKALISQPSLNLKLVRPQLKVIQDLLGPRLADFEIISGEDSNDVIYILEGEKSYPALDITKQGLGIGGERIQNTNFEFRSDNSLAIYNFQAAEQALKEFLVHAKNGTISQLRIVDAKIIMHDSVYGFLREYSNINLELYSSVKENKVFGKFDAKLAGRTTIGTFQRTINNENIFLNAKIKNLDFSSVLAFLDSKDALIALKGTGDISLDVQFNKLSNDIENGLFKIDAIEADLRVVDDLFPVKSEEVLIDWLPALAKFSLREVNISVGNSSAKVLAQFITGIDKTYGPTLSMSIEAQRVSIYPNDLLAPQTPFDKISLIGWSAPLYGALGIDYLVAQKPGVEIRVKGRADMLRSGMGMKFEIGAEGASSDDLKRLWPYFIAGDARDWFVKNVKQGTLKNGNMSINFPIGTLPKLGEEMPLPQGAIKVAMIAKDVSIVPLRGMNATNIEGDVILSMNDYEITANMQRAYSLTKLGRIEVENGAVIIDSQNPKSTLYELSGDISGKMGALLAFSRKHLPNLLDEKNISINLDELSANVSSSVVTTLSVNSDNEIVDIDYAANGKITDFTSQNPIAGYSIDNGQFSFSATQNGYNIDGTTKIAGLVARLKLNGVLGEEQNLIVSSELNINEIKEFGFDLSEFMSGKIKFAINILEDGIWKVSADLKNAGLNIVDIGISKKKGVAGSMSAIIEQKDNEYIITNSVLAFGNVKIAGDILVKNNKLQSANFPTFILSKGDNASLKVKPLDSGVSLIIRGKTMDLKPMLRRSFALDKPSAGAPRSTQYNQRLLLDVKLNKAIGFYKTVASNFNLNMELRGDDMRHVSLQAQFPQNKAVSISTNQTQGGRTMVVAFSDLGALLRFLNVYPRLFGGKGSLAMSTSSTSKLDEGTIVISNFSIVEESKVGQILGSYSDGNSNFAGENSVKLNYGKVNFTRRSDRIEITDAVLDGGEIGGTLRGFIYTKKGEYDLVGTYVPLFGLNSVFQKIPLFGVILGGREGEGLIGVTFAIRGNLDKPQFILNPASILAPGMFRSLFEFRSQEAPRETE